MIALILICMDSTVSLTCHYKVKSGQDSILTKCNIRERACSMVMSATNSTIYSSGCIHIANCPPIPNCDLFEDNLMWCCCLLDACNDESLNHTINYFPMIVPTTAIQQVKYKTERYPVWMLLLIAVAFFGMIVLIFCLVQHFQRPFGGSPSQLLAQRAGSRIVLSSYGLELLHEDEGKKIYRGVHEGRDMALKVSNSSDLLRELSVFDILCRSESFANVAQMMGVASLSGTLSCFGMMMEYFPERSVYDLLKHGNGVLEVRDLNTLVSSLVSGLVFLHDNRPDKPSIAHRNIKSSKILIRRSQDGVLSSFISDLSLAVAFGGPVDLGRTGDMRYMAPELLLGLTDLDNSAYLSVDMYAFSLVAWEMMSSAGGMAYTAPFECASVDEMRELVCVRKDRPSLRTEWTLNDEYGVLCKVISACWDGDASARLSAQCVEQMIMR